MRVLSIDPGADTGWCLFDPELDANPPVKGLAAAAGHRPRGRGALVACGVRSKKCALPDPVAAGRDPSTAIVEIFGERPKIYPNSKAPPSDIITLAIRAGEAIGPYRYPPPGTEPAKVTYYEPWEWKGSVAKNVHHSRLWAVLGPEEKAIVHEAALGMAPSKRHNLMDAIGIGLFALGRTRCGGV